MVKIDAKIVKWELMKDEIPNDVPQYYTESEENVILTDVKLPSDAPARMKTLRDDTGRKWYLTVVFDTDNKKPIALFCITNNKEKTAPIENAVEILIELARSKGILEEHINDLLAKVEHDTNVNKLSRSISLLLRHNVSIPNIVNKLDKIENVFVNSFLFQIKKFLSQYIRDGEKVEGAICTNCESTNIVYQSGCSTCLSCGHSKCG
jgi:hypothetical protein